MSNLYVPPLTKEEAILKAREYQLLVGKNIASDSNLQITHVVVYPKSTDAAIVKHFDDDLYQSGHTHNALLVSSETEYVVLLVHYLWSIAGRKFRTLPSFLEEFPDEASE